jgi:hypothetical protein
MVAVYVASFWEDIVPALSVRTQHVDTVLMYLDPIVVYNAVVCILYIIFSLC